MSINASAIGIKVFHYLFFFIAIVTAPMAIFTGFNVVPDVGVIEAAPDNEFRFFSVFWLAYGIFCFWVARDLPNRCGFIPALAITMFTAGVARMLSTVMVGYANDAYFYGAVFELISPFVWYFCYRQYRRQAGIA
jgi:Domain of unknown function (DUF4345)